MLSAIAGVRMVSRGALVLLIFGLLGDPGAEEGREGNAAFEEGQYAEAAAAYRDGLSALDDTTGTRYTALQNNLGLALHRQQDHSGAQLALRRARRSATTDAERVRARFNSGTVAAAMGNRSEALDHYRRVLLLDPTHEDARFNYEYLMRQRGSRSSQASTNIDPSPYAQKLKQKADALVARAEYTTAAALMKDGLRQDSTVAAYQNFLTRVEEIAQINRSDP